MKWEYYTDTEDMRILFFLDKPTEIGMDTETTGLHIKFDTAFLVVLGWINKDGIGRVFTFQPDKDNMHLAYRMCGLVNKVFFWNTKYDMHMLANTGHPYPHSNLSDGMFYARLALFADEKQSLALKQIGKRFVSNDASLLQDNVKAQMSMLTRHRTKLLADQLKPLGWKKVQVEAFLKDIVNEEHDLEEPIRTIYREWLAENPEPTYADVDIGVMTQYAGYDVALMLEFIEIAKPVIAFRKQEVVLEREERLIRPLYDMERVGFLVDMHYMKERKQVVKDYIKKQRARLHEVAGVPITIGQHVAIKRLIEVKWGVTMESSDETALKLASANSDQPDLIEFCELVVELRTLEKWYATYILRIMENSKRDGRMYTQINQAGTVTGRVSSDFQQFPKGQLHDKDGNELFNPRRCFLISGGMYGSTFYLD